MSFQPLFEGNKTFVSYNAYGKSVQYFGTRLCIENSIGSNASFLRTAPFSDKFSSLKKNFHVRVKSAIYFLFLDKNSLAHISNLLIIQKH